MKIQLDGVDENGKDVMLIVSNEDDDTTCVVVHTLDGDAQINVKTIEFAAISELMERINKLEEA